MLTTLLIALTFANPPVKTQRCLATVFGQVGDKYAGERLACTGQRIADNRNMLGIAHRWLRCGTRVVITYRGRSVTATVVDRGPYLGYPEGCKIGNRDEWMRCRRLLLRPRPGWKYRACIDMLPGTAKAIGHPGWGRVTIQYTVPRRRRKKVAER